jgi:GNAT superfamily N-acetyltransferase
MSERIRIVEAHEFPWLLEIRTLFQEYVDSLGFELDFQDFEREFEDLPGEYGPPDGRLFLALVDDEPVGCIALRRIDPSTCELKRMYVRPELRGRGIGRRLAERIVLAAREIGYARMRLDTVPGMDAAIGVYRSLGFTEIEPYRFNPIEGAIYMELELRDLRT